MVLNIYQGHLIAYIDKKRKKAAYQRWLTTRDGEDRKQYVRMSRVVKKGVIKKKNGAWERKCVEINSYIGGTRSTEAWKVIRNLRTNERTKLNIPLISLEKWKTYYENLLRENRIPNLWCRSYK